MRRTLGVSIFIAAAWVSAAHAQGAAPAAPAPPAAAANGEFVDAPEKPVVQKACTSCHVASQVTSQAKSAEQWSETVEKMISYGAKVSDEEFATIVSYLAKHYGPGGAAAGGGR